MIYRKLIPSEGKIFIDGARHTFIMASSFYVGYVEITAFYRGKAVSGHKIPVDADLGVPFRTGGHQYKVTKQQTII